MEAERIEDLGEERGDVPAKKSLAKPNVESELLKHDAFLAEATKKELWDRLVNYISVKEPNLKGEHVFLKSLSDARFEFLLKEFFRPGFEAAEDFFARNLEYVTTRHMQIQRDKRKSPPVIWEI